jgi:hypothetical protein
MRGPLRTKTSLYLKPCSLGGTGRGTDQTTISTIPPAWASRLLNTSVAEAT